MTAPTFSVRAALRSKRLLITGASGFLGKVWLAHLIEAVGELGRIHILLRPKRGRRAHERLVELLETSPAFERLHARHGSGLGEVLSPRRVPGPIPQPEMEHLGAVGGIARFEGNRGCSGFLDVE